jgi:hypothetical protein
MDNLLLFGSILYWVSLGLVICAFYLAGLFLLAGFDDWLIDHGKPSQIPDDPMTGLVVWLLWPLFIVWHWVPVLFAWLGKVPE